MKTMPKPAVPKKTVKPKASKKEMEAKKSLAYRLYMAGEEQKVIAESIDVSERSLSNWATEGNWKTKRSASIITRDELVKKILSNINDMLDESSASEDPEYSKLSNQLIQMANTVEKLDKNNVVNDMQTFSRFNNHLQQLMVHNTAITAELLKQINKLQNDYITFRMDGE